MKKNKTVCVILAGLLVVITIAGTLFGFYNQHNKKDSSLINKPLNSKNYVEFRDNVHIADDSHEIKKDYYNISVNSNEYSMFYKNDIPDFFKEMRVGEIFCVYPDNKSSESFFAQGFCGKLTNIQQTEETCSVSFTVPKLTDVFSDVYINTKESDETSVQSTAFYPNEGVTGIQGLQDYNSPQTLMRGSFNKSSYFLESDVDCKYKKPTKESLLDDYIMICDELKLKVDGEFEDEDGFGVGAKGSVTLRDTAVKMHLDYHYDESEDKVQINDYSLGFITKQKINLNLSAEKRVDLNSFSADLSDNVQIIDIKDATEKEEGKLVLGTYLIGMEAALPILENSTNKVNYLSLGIAIQFTVTGSGKLSLEYDIENSGFVQVEMNDNGSKTYINKGYDYPNPVVEDREPTDVEASSVPDVSSKIKGQANLKLACGGDIGICILGMVPIKLANNFIELDIEKSISKNLQEEEKTDVIKNYYLLDDNVDKLVLSSNSYIKMHLGAEFKFHNLKKEYGVGAKFKIFKKVWFQTPPTIGFSHSQCGFGGVYVGETYSDEELDNAFKTYMKDTDQDSIVTSVKDFFLGSLFNKAFETFNFDPLDFATYLGEDAGNYKVNYYTSGVIYIRDESNKVIATFVTGKDVANISGVHNGLSASKIETIYSDPDLSSEVEIKLGWLIKYLFDIESVEDAKFANEIHFSSDSKEKANMIYCNDSLIMIIITEK